MNDIYTNRDCLWHRPRPPLSCKTIGIPMVRSLFIGTIIMK